VQHVTVEDGGQAIVAGKVRTRGQRRKRKDSGGVVSEIER
jgi:hypothetical protein